MVWFQRLFPILMILWPVLTVLLLPARFRTQDDRGGLARLWMMTGAFLMVHFVVFLSLEATLPVSSAWRIAWPVFIAVLGSMLLWFAFAVRMVNDPARVRGDGRSGDGPVPPGAGVRTASLVPRHKADPVPRRAWVVGWMVFGLCVVVMAWAIREGASAGVIGGLGFWLFSGPLAARMSLLEPEPMDQSGSRELADAYERLRSFKAWTFYWMGLVGTVAFTGIAVALALRPSVGGWVGAGVGTLIGLAGAVVGVVGGLRRARVHEMQQALAAEGNGK